MKYALFDTVTKILITRYDSDFHGSREIAIQDPNWVRPVHDVTVLAGETFNYNGGSVLNNTAETRIVRDVPDLSVEPEYITVKNPDCKIPSEAIEVSETLFYRLMNEQDGIWYLIDDEVVKLPLPEPTTEELMSQAVQAVKQKLQATIDEKAVSLGFSKGDSVIQYAGYPNRYQQLALIFGEWEANVWGEADDYNVEVLAGNKPMLSPEEAVAMMPAYPV